MGRREEEEQKEEEEEVVVKLAREINFAARIGSRDAEVESSVRAIIGEVSARRDVAVCEFAKRFDDAAPNSGLSFEIAPADWERRAEKTDPSITAALGRAAERIARFHRGQQRPGYQLDDGELALRVVPLARVGLYVPGGTALYPSSVLMNAVPAMVAGVGEVVMVTPRASAEALRAAQIAGVHRVFEVGGAHAVAALAVGTDSIPRVDKIVGPGNRFVAEAKRQVYGWVDIDSVAGPSEVLIVADSGANPRWIAADLLAQAEHDAHALAILVSTSEQLVLAVESELDKQLETLPRAEIARAALTSGGAAVVVSDIGAAIEIAERYAPEHLELQVVDARAVADQIHSASAIFVGPYSPEAAGDYCAGPNHVLPTAGAARYASPLGVYDFVKHISVIELSAQKLKTLSADIRALAAVEGLDAHGRSVAVRFEDGDV